MLGNEMIWAPKTTCFVFPFCSWNNELEQSWKALFHFMIYFMKLGYHDNDDDEDGDGEHNKSADECPAAAAGHIDAVNEEGTNEMINDGVSA